MKIIMEMISHITLMKPYNIYHTNQISTNLYVMC